MNTVQIVERQRELLNAIVLDVGDAEGIAEGLIGLESRHRLLVEKLAMIRETATAWVIDPHINAVILSGYKADCLDSLLGLQRLMHMTVVAGEEDGMEEPSDEQLQHLAIAARSYTDRVEKYLQLQADMVKEENHG